MYILDAMHVDESGSEPVLVNDNFGVMQPGLLMVRRGLALVASLLAIGCTGDPDAGYGFERSAIVNGEPSDENDDEVVSITAEVNEPDRPRLFRNDDRSGRDRSRRSTA